MHNTLKSILAGCSFAILTTSSFAAVSVVDIGLIRTNLANARRDLAEQVLQRGQQATQIQKLITQIQQVDRYLNRFGDPKNVTLTTFKDAVDFLEKLDVSKSSEEIIKDLKKDEVFQKKSGSPYETLKREIVVGGKTVGEQNSEVFAPEVASRRAFEHYQEVRSATLQQRRKLKQEMEATLQQLRSASTSSEVQKLGIVMRSLEAQLAATDREIQFAANEVMARHFQNEVEERVQDKARVQRERATVRVGTEKDLGFYRLPSKPLLFKR